MHSAKPLSTWGIRALKSAALIFGVWLFLLTVSIIGESPVCSVDIVNSVTGWRMDGAPPECYEVDRKVVKFGENKYTKIADKVYWMSEKGVRDFPTCLIGLGCFRSIARKHTSIRSVKLIDLYSAIDFEKLKGYMGGEYVSDGYTVFNGWRKLPLLKPPINPGNLHRLVDKKTEGGQYVTDGTWIFYEGNHVVEANLPTFQVFPQPADVPKESTKLARDINTVYYGSEPVSQADPDTFELVVLPPEDPREGYYGLDKNYVWILSGHPEIVDRKYSEEIRRRVKWLRIAKNKSLEK
ncbi:MAG: hypothetical protein K0S28_2488 [Paucimonas sp.]|nr:hypothetical protein [Paucimonas sp.]